MAAREREVAGQRRRPVQRPATGGDDTEEEAQESGSAGRDEGWILRDPNWNSCCGRKR